jgi:protein TonB
VWRSTPTESDKSKQRAAEHSSIAPSIGESVSGSADPGPVSDGTAAVGNGGDPGSRGGGGGAMMAIPFGEGMKRPMPIAQPAPVYTREASAVKAAGVVTVRCIITVEGTLKDCRVLHGVPFMDAAVLESLARWKYTPVTFQGRPVSVYYVINIRLVAP